MSSYSWLYFALGTVVTWGLYGIFLHMGQYQLTCTGCQACNGQLSCMCEDTMMIPRPAQIPLDPPCPGGFHNCNGNLQCSAC